MSTSRWRVAAAGTTVVSGAAIGAVTNLLTDRWSVSLFAVLVALVVIGVALQVLVTVGEGAGSGSAMRARATGHGRILQAGRDVNLGGRGGSSRSGDDGEGPVR